MSAAQEAFKLVTALARYDARLETYAELGAIPTESMEEEVLGLATRMQTHAEAVRPLKAEVADAMDFAAGKLAKQAEVLGDMHRERVECQPGISMVMREAALIATSALSVATLAAQHGITAADTGRRVLH
jgi:hypothetical protein